LGFGFVGRRVFFFYFLPVFSSFGLFGWGCHVFLFFGAIPLSVCCGPCAAPQPFSIEPVFSRAAAPAIVLSLAIPPPDLLVPHSPTWPGLSFPALSTFIEPFEISVFLQDRIAHVFGNRVLDFLPSCHSFPGLFAGFGSLRQRPTFPLSSMVHRKRQIACPPCVALRSLAPILRSVA